MKTIHCGLCPGQFFHTTNKQTKQDEDELQWFVERIAVILPSGSAGWSRARSAN
jgi:hypothetical protein